jgi:hypothetical protein
VLLQSPNMIPNENFFSATHNPSPHPAKKGESTLPPIRVSFGARGGFAPNPAISALAPRRPRRGPPTPSSQPSPSARDRPSPRWIPLPPMLVRPPPPALVRTPPPVLVPTPPHRPLEHCRGPFLHFCSRSCGVGGKATTCSQMRRRRPSRGRRPPPQERRMLHHHCIICRRQPPYPTTIWTRPWQGKALTLLANLQYSTRLPTLIM